MSSLLVMVTKHRGYVKLACHWIGYLGSERVDVSDEIAEVVIGEHAPEGGHLRLADRDDVAHALVVHRLSAHHELLLVEAGERWAVALIARVGLVADEAVLVVDTASARLLRGEVQLCV